MVLTDERVLPASCASDEPFRARLTLICHVGILAILMISWPARAEEDEDRFLHIVDIIQQADALETKGNTNAALAKYREAQSALRDFHRTYLYWNPKVVAYRSKYLADKIAACWEKMAPAGDGREAQPQAKATGADSVTQVKLIKAGSEPRRVLRLHANPGDKQTVSMTIKMGMDMKIGEMENPAMKLPTMNMSMDVAIQSVSDDGNVKYDVVMTDAGIAEDPGVLPQVAEALKSSFAGLKGVTGSGTVSSRGFNKGTDLKASSGINPQIQQAIEQMKQSFSSLWTPLPEEPVGPGAKWEAKTPMKSQGMTFEQTTSYALVSLEGESLVAKTEIVQSASNQRIQSPAMPALKLDLTKMVGTGTGGVTLDLTRLMPLKANLDSHSELTMGMNAGGQNQGMTMKMDLAVQMEAK